MKRATYPGSLSLRGVLALGVLSILVAPQAAAQVPAEPTPPPQSTAPVPPEAAPLRAEKLDQFADAYLLIEEIHTQAAAALEETENPAQANDIRTQAEGQIIQAVERSGLNLDEFNQIAELAALDPAFRMQLADRVEKRRRI